LDLLLVGLLSFAAVFVLVFTGIHVGIALLIVAIGGLVAVKGVGVAFGTLQYVPYVTVANYNLAVFPLFILMGELASVSGMVSMLFEGAQAWLGRLKGGLAMAVTAMGAALGAVTGSGIASCAMMARVGFPEMVKRKYDPAASAGMIAAVGMLAVLIPPSILLALYGIIAEVSVGKLLIAGFIPGLLSAILYMMLIYTMATRNPEKWPLVERRFTWRERINGLKGIAPIIIMLVTVIGGIYAGVFTPSEAGAAGTIMAVIFVVVLQRKESGRAILRGVWESAGVTSMIFLITIGALLYGRFMSSTGATDQIINFIAGFPVSPYITFAAIVIFYLILGCFIDSISMIAITVPMTQPLMEALGFNPIWFGVIVVILAEAGCVTPPFGLVVFTVKGIVGDQAELWAIFKGALPFLIGMIAMIILLVIWPQIALFLPSMM
jgi:tripartite ATP-independent transporter DctM subunit